MELSLTDEDVQVLRDVLHTVISDLSPEIADTDNPEYRRKLRAHREGLRRIVDKLDRAGTP